MINQRVPEERNDSLHVFDLFLAEIDEYRELVKQNEASLEKKDKEISAMRDELSAMADLISAMRDVGSSRMM